MMKEIITVGVVLINWLLGQSFVLRFLKTVVLCFITVYLVLKS